MNNQINLEALNALSEEERKVALEILKEYAAEGKSNTLKKIQFPEYKEVPVDIETFITNDMYLGQAWKDVQGNLKIYPFWMEQLKKLFPNNVDTNFGVLLESGARGIGKSEIACGAVGAYLLYRVLCMKNPLEFYHLKPTEKICFAFMNIKLALAEEIAISKFQKTLQMSPWFMARGTMTQKNNQPYWVPPEPVSIIIGSQSDDVIGKPIFFCLDGETQIYTDTGYFKISELVDKEIRVPTINNDGNIELSDVCTVKVTGEFTEEYEIELEDGSIIKCTPNHRFMLKDGTYREAQYLTENDELADVKPFGYIYKFTNAVTNKIYIGKREKSVFDLSYWGSGKDWLQDLNKYGKENIYRDILCWGFSRQELNQLEQMYIKQFQSQNPQIGYNIHKGGQGGNSLGDTEKWADLHRGNKNGRFGKTVSNETRTKISKANKGKIRTEDFKLNVSRTLSGRKKPPNFGQKLSKSTKGRKNTWAYKKVICIETGEIFESLKEASEIKKIYPQNISRSCRSTYTAGGYHWRFVDEN